VHFFVEGIQRILLHLACSSMAPHSQSRGRKRRKGRKEEEGAFRGDGLGACEPQQSGARRQRDNAQESVHFSHSFFGLNFCFYLDELGSQNRYAPLTHNADKRVPYVRFHKFSY
jgi:hypothetical protein